MSLLIAEGLDKVILQVPSTPNYSIIYYQTQLKRHSPFLCRWTKHILRSVLSAVSAVLIMHLLRVWYTEEKSLPELIQKLILRHRVSSLITYAGYAQRAETFFTTSLLSLWFWNALIPWRPNSLHIQHRSVPPIQEHSGFLQREMLRWKSVASYPSCHFILCWNVPEHSGCIRSGNTNTAKAELQHWHMVVQTFSA